MIWVEFSTAWQGALEMAWEAYCDDCVPIGAVTTDENGRLLSRGRNRIYSKRSPDGRRRGNTLAHAEVEALGKVDYDGFDPHTGRLYTTMEPCPMCMGAFYMSGFRTVYFAARDPYAGSVNLLSATAYLSRKPIQVHPPSDMKLESVLIALFLEYDLATGHEQIRGKDLYSLWQNCNPRGVELGEELYRSGELRRCRPELSAQTAFDWLLGLVGDVL
jgi:tRNA(Arg) A34 adenosine deaminase TadA